MSYTSQLDAFVLRLNDSASDYRTKHSILSELLDTIETFNGAAEYEYFLKSLMPVFLKQLGEEIPISFVSTSAENKTRNSILEILHRSIMNDTFQPYSEPVLDMLTKILTEENEENGVLCMKIITSLHKAYKANFSEKVSPFIKIIEQIYDNMDQTVKDVFTDESANEETKEEAKEEAKEEVKDEAMEETKDEAMEEANEEANEDNNEEANEEAKEEANEEAKEEAKDEIKDESKKEDKVENTQEGEANVESENQKSEENGNGTTENDEDSKDSTTTDTTKVVAAPTTSFNEETSTKILRKAMFSFKTLAECPITMVSLYSSYKQLVATSLLQFLPKIIHILQLQVEDQKQLRDEAIAKNEVLVSISPKIKNRQAYSELILGQVKAASFLAYVFIRGYAGQYLKPEESKCVPDVILRLLQDCPAELSVARKELLHATRHILSTPFRTQFIPKLDLLFNEKILIGEGLTSYETLRPLAYSTVADFIHNVRNELTPAQIWSTVHIYCNLLKDDSLALTVQIMSAKLLLNLVEKIMKLPNKLEGRQLFLIIIDSYAKRFESLNRKYDYIIAKHNEHEKKKSLKEKESKRAIERYSSKNQTRKDQIEQEQISDKENGEMDVDKEEAGKDARPEVDEQLGLNFFNIDSYSPIATLQNSASNSDVLKDARYLFKTLMTFLKSVVFGLKNCNPPVPPQPVSTDPSKQQQVNYDKWNESAKLISGEEVNILRALFREGISCLRFFAASKPKVALPQKAFDYSTGGTNLPITSSKEEKDLMEIFATIFINFDPASFNEIVSSELPFLFDSMLDNAALLHLPQFFLASEVTSANFSSILISFLKGKLDQLGQADIVKTSILTRLFKLCFMSVNLFPATNEAVLLPHLNYLILESLKLSTRTEEPIVYSYLVRLLFRSISGGRFENLYKEIMPILPVLLENLNKMIANAKRPYERDIYVELCLTVPVRLSVLVPHLSYLTRPLVYALNGSQELVTQGLRTFELCVDNLTAEYFDPMIEPVIDDIMAALWKHLEPVPYHHQHSHTAIRILGKLGGRNHKKIKPCDTLHTQTDVDQEIKALVHVYGLNDKVPISITPGVESAIKLLNDRKMKIHYRISAYKYLASILKLFVDTTPIPENFVQYAHESVEFLSKERIDESIHIDLQPSDIKDAEKLDRQQQLFSKLLEMLYFAISVPELKDEASKLIDGLTTHFTILHLGRSVIDKIKKERNFSVQDNEGKAYISETAFFDAITYALSFGDKDVRDKGIETVKKIHETTVIIFGSEENALISPIFRSLFYKFTHCCYNEFYNVKFGGVLGLRTMFHDLQIPHTWFYKRQFELLRSLFFILRDTPDTAPYEVCHSAKNLVIELVKTCNKDLTREIVMEKPFQTLVGALVYDLASPTPTVREVAQECLKVLSEVTSTPITSIMGPCKHLLLTPIFGKPLRALPFPMQIGNIDAITFCLGLPDTFLSFNEELNRLLLEALALVDAEDESLANVHRLNEYRTSKQLVELRVVCIRLLSLALSKPDFSIGSLAEARIRILGVFFKALCNKSTEIINAAHQGLASSLQENAKLPKELLQNGLRPMLMNLSDHKKLTVSGLEALARLLELLISYFRVEIGRKLLDHLMAWAQINTLRQIAGQNLDNNHTVQIVMAILNIFHLLPAKAYTFMEEIINTLQYLEGHLDRHLDSPFRKPVSKFLNRFAENCIEYLVNNFKNRKLGNMLASIAGMDGCENLRQTAQEKIQFLIEDIKGEVDFEAKVVKLANFIDLFNAIAQHDKEWFDNQKGLLIILYEIVGDINKVSATPMLSNAHFQSDQAITKLQHLVVEYLKRNQHDIDLLINVVDSHCRLKRKVSNELQDFIFNDIVASSDVDLRLRYLNETASFVSNPEPGRRSKIFMLKHIFNPIFIYEFARNKNVDVFFATEQLSTSSSTSATVPAPGTSPSSSTSLSFPFWLQSIDENIWQSTNDVIVNPTSGKMDGYRYALLETTALLLKIAPQKVRELRKDIIKFSWNYIKLDDNITKQVAYVTTSYFIAAYETPAKLATQVFVALLRTHQTDSRHLVRQALDILAPVMSERMKDEESPDNWLKWPRRIISEDGFNVTQVLNVYQFIVQHPDLFFIAREHFIANIITAMGKLTILANPAIENQVLAIELAELILYWERKAKNEAKKLDAGVANGDHDIDMDSNMDTKKVESNKQAEAEAEAETEANANAYANLENSEHKDVGIKDENTNDADAKHKKMKAGEVAKDDFKTSISFSVPFGQREACVTFLIRYVCISPQRASESELGQKALGILYDLLSPEHWPEVSIKLSFFEKFLLSNDLNSSNLLGYCLNALEVLAVVLEWKQPQWIVSNISYLQKLLEKCIKSDNHDISEILQRVLTTILAAINNHKSGYDEDEEDDDVKEFITLLTTSVSEDLGDMPSVAAGVTLAWTLAQCKPATLDPLLPTIMKTFSKLCKDHITITHQGSQNASSSSSSSQSSKDNTNQEFEAKMTTKLLEKILNLCSMRISNLGDQRRIFLSLLAQLIERSLDKESLEKIIKIVKGWVFSKIDLFPTTKEKAAILSKMMVFEVRGEPTLSREFYQIIVDIFEDDLFSCTELTVRMEQPFMVGTRSLDVSIRRKLMSILNNSLEKDISKRLYYVIREQNWEYLADYPWLNQALQLLFGSFNMNAGIEFISEENKLSPIEAVPLPATKGDDQMEVDSSNEKLTELLNSHQEFLNDVCELSASDIFDPLTDMFYQSSEAVHRTWGVVFPIAFKSIPRSEHLDFTRFLVILLSKDYHTRQIDMRPNVIQSLLEGVSRCWNLQLPPFAVECLATNFDAWSQGLHILESMTEEAVNANADVRDVIQDALTKLYATLKEDDMFYGIWRRRAKYTETISALSYEQIGLWDKAQQLYESAQIKARSGALPYGESEYALWEDHWILCSEKLQHWDILTDLARHEGFSDLLLECGWRVADWYNDRETLDHTVKNVMDVPTPRRQVFETFLCLQGFGQEKETLQDLSRLCDEGIQLALRKWHGLPKRFTNAHIPLLHTFQQYVEFMEASQVYASLVSTNAQNLDVKSQELKRVLQVWRERLPNIWDDINIWNDLVTWRQHAFQVINKVYMPFIPILQQSNSGSNANSYAYRGFHEIAWVINRFAHVARKHNMPEVCIKELTRIYQLPNIEIHEAFLKLKEQVKCHYQNPNELNTGLDVISNTNLVYFATQQKAEFFTLKGMFLNKLNQKDEANKAFATSVQIDLNLPKAWAEWGMFNDRRFKENPDDMVYANNAISCYLQAAGLYKNGKTRKLLARILWLISLDDASGTLAQAFENFRGEVPVWYWITFIPQLLTSLSHREAKLAKQILVRIAKAYPQALHFQLRTTREDFAAQQRQAIEIARQQAAAAAAATAATGATGATGAPVSASVPGSAAGVLGSAHNSVASPSGPSAASAGSTAVQTPVANANGVSLNKAENNNVQNEHQSPKSIGSQPPSQSQSPVQLANVPHTQQNSHSHGSAQAHPQTAGRAPSQPHGQNPQQMSISVPLSVRQPLEHVEEIMAILKTAYPLLALSLESLVDQINQRFKCTPDEDAYRLGVALLNDGVQYMNRLGNPRADAKLPPITEANITRFAETVLPKQIRAEFEKDLVLSKPNLETYITKLRKWRDRLEDRLDRRPTKVNLENLCPHLGEIHHQKFEEIEIPGQYLLNKDNNSHFVKIERFISTIELARGTNACYKRLKIRGHDGSLHTFAVQFPAARHCRREESVFQLFRIFNDSISRKVETRRRNIQLLMPTAVPLSPHIRIVNDNVNDISLQKIYEGFCKKNGKSRDEPFIYTVDKLRAAFDPRLPKPDLASIRVEILSAIQTLLVPSTVLKNYFLELYPRFDDFWLFRKQFTSQYASFIFTTYMLCVNARQPQKIHVGKNSGNVWTSDMLPCKIPNRAAIDPNNPQAKQIPIFVNAEQVPFRLTPNIQKLIGESGLEGILAVNVLCIARALLEPGSDLEQYLTLFVKDEAVSWLSQSNEFKNASIASQDKQLRDVVKLNVESITKRVMNMGHIPSNGGVTTQHMLELISQAVNPRNLAAADTLWMAYF